MSRIRFISSVPALVYDPEFKRIVRVVRQVDTTGQVWEEYDGGPLTPIESPQRAKRSRKKQPNPRRL